MSSPKEKLNYELLQEYKRILKENKILKKKLKKKTLNNTQQKIQEILKDHYHSKLLNNGIYLIKHCRFAKSYGVYFYFNHIKETLEIKQPYTKKKKKSLINLRVLDYNHETKIKLYYNKNKKLILEASNYHEKMLIIDLINIMKN